MTGILLAAYEYVVNGRPATEWIMERYQLSTDKDSGITNDPNDWAREHDDPQYILNLVKRIVTVSLETMKVVNALQCHTIIRPAMLIFFAIFTILICLITVIKELAKAVGMLVALILGVMIVVGVTAALWQLAVTLVPHVLGWGAIIALVCFAIMRARKK